MPPASSPSRRVLGEKDTNASINISSPRKVVTADPDSRSFATTQARARALSGAINAAMSSPRAGQKRRITEVEGVEAQDWEERMRASQTTDVISDSASETDQLDTSMLSTRSAADTTMTSFGIGPSQENLAEQQFELLEPEMSQKTLDKIHAVTLPQNTSQPSQLRHRPELIHNASQDSVGMSAFLNLYSDPSSQASDGLKTLDASLGRQEATENSGIQPKEISEDDQRKTLMEERATRLRTQLQLALFKVETRQTNTPFSRLKIPESHKRVSLSSPVLPAPPRFLHKQSNSISFPNERSGFSPEARIAALRAQATMQHKPVVRSLDSLPIPEIKPTAFSARWADEAPDVGQAHSTPRVADSGDNAVTYIPSSPPVSSHPLHIHEDETATRSRKSSAAEAERLPASSDPHTSVAKAYSNSPLPSTPPNPSSGVNVEDSDAGMPSLVSKDKAGPKKRRLTSSVGKGEAASGLLQLMRSGAVNAENVRGPMCGL